ncbi:MAG: ABC transporter ATP-binding protein [Candidatus Aureabacteria bacterium]|nr:ABC transporter ATP-binding protein [Candidatus Auribacterota bacterium]
MDLTIEPGDFLAVMGPSGSGKSTLLHLLGCLDRPTGGELYFQGENVRSLSVQELALFRASRIAFVFQNDNLIPQLTLRENVELPFIYLTIQPEEVKRRVDEAFHQVGLIFRVDHKPNQLSGGEQQRGAVARALAMNAELIIADEPTGSLDLESGRRILSLLKKCHEEGKTVILATHNQEMAAYAKRRIFLKDGSLILN